MTDAGRAARPLSELLSARPLFGMIHRPPLPGSPGERQGLDELVAFALDEARILEAAGMDAVIVENVGDAPFFKSSVLAVGVNLLRNACLEHRNAPRGRPCRGRSGSFGFENFVGLDGRVDGLREDVPVGT